MAVHRLGTGHERAHVPVQFLADWDRDVAGAEAGATDRVVVARTPVSPRISSMGGRERYRKAGDESAVTACSATGSLLPC
jgi:hypothetical protein